MISEAGDFLDEGHHIERTRSGTRQKSRETNKEEEGNEEERTEEERNDDDRNEKDRNKEDSNDDDRNNDDRNEGCNDGRNDNVCCDKQEQGGTDDDNNVVCKVINQDYNDLRFYTSNTPQQNTPQRKFELDGNIFVNKMHRANVNMAEESPNNEKTQRTTIPTT